jgi:hypothetical protein
MNKSKPGIRLEWGGYYLQKRKYNVRKRRSSEYLPEGAIYLFRGGRCLSWKQ